MIKNLVLFLFFFTSWYILSGENKEFFLIAGVFSSLICVVLANKIGGGFDARYNIGAVGYGFWLLKEIAVSAWQVTKVIWSPQIKISPKFAEIATQQSTVLGQVTYANSITLTPGTITVEVDSENKRFLVHALQSKTVDDLEMEGAMDKRISKIIKAAE